MQNNYVSCYYVVTTPFTYCSALVDLTRSRSVHAVEHNPCCPDPTLLSASQCKAVHYGLCSPLLKLPSFTIPTSAPSSPSPNSPTTPKGTPHLSDSPKSRSTPNSPKTPTSNVHSPASPSTPSNYHPLASPVSNTSPLQSMASPKTSQVDIEMFDPVELLAVDLEGKLEALVSTFVAQDKVRLAARKKEETNGKSPSTKLLKRSPRSNDPATRQESDVDTGQRLVSQKDKAAGLYPNVLDNVSLFQDGLGLGSKSHPLDYQHATSILRPSPEYQQTGVKAQINKFTSKEKENAQSSPVNSMERRTPKAVKDPSTTCFKPGPLSLEELQELLKSTEVQEDPLKFQPAYESPPPHADIVFNTPNPSDSQLVSPKSLPDESLNYAVYQNSNALKHPSSSHFDPTFNTIGNQDYMQSAVDYAKKRYQRVQEDNTTKLEEAKLRPKNGHLVTEARYKWEHQWSPMTESAQQNGGDHDSASYKRPLSIEGLMESPSIPHPKLTSVQKQHIKERSLSPTDRHNHVPIRPFLTKGSVAERVLLFECCPDRALERTVSGSKNKPLLMNTWRSGGSEVQHKAQLHPHSIRDKENIAPSSTRTSSLKRFASSRAKSLPIPKFYYPEGKPASAAETETHLKRVASVFSGFNQCKATREEFGIITKACGLPLYWKLPLFLAVRGDKKNAVSCDAFLEYWRRIVNTCHDEATKFTTILSRGTRNYLIAEDFIPFMQDVIDSHPGLTFLKEATEFHSRYIHTVIARIYYCVNKSWSNKITVPELRKSNFLQVLATLEEEEDINQITEYFSYEHFYVIYCKFWELDKDHDLFIDQNDLRHHNGGALSTKIIQRIFSGAVTRGPVKKDAKMSYTEFVWFLISEEDKRHPRSIEYWFRCMDLDGDGFLSMYELEYFYKEQLLRLEALGIETLPFGDCLCQMLDIIKPKVTGKISLADLKSCKMTPIFFDTFFNLEKYLDHEQRDPFAMQREHDGEGTLISDWDRYAADEYELLVAEESVAEQQDELICDDFENRVDSFLVKTSHCNVDKKVPIDDDCDYADTDIDYHY